MDLDPDPDPLVRRHRSADPDPEPHQNVMDLEHCFPERSKTERGRESPELALSAGEHSDIWLERKDLGTGTSLLLCPGKLFRQGN